MAAVEGLVVESFYLLQSDDAHAAEVEPFVALVALYHGGLVLAAADAVEHLLSCGRCGLHGSLAQVIFNDLVCGQIGRGRRFFSAGRLLGGLFDGWSSRAGHGVFGRRGLWDLLRIHLGLGSRDD